MEKKNLGKDLIFKGGTLLSRNYLKYHRFSEDLDFVHKDSGSIRELNRSARERAIQQCIDSFAPNLKEVSEELGLEFNSDMSKLKFCTILHGRTVYIFRIYYSEFQYIKIEINFIEKMIDKPQGISVKAITDFFDSSKLLFDLNLSYKNFNVLSYSLKEIILEKYRALLTRREMKERDLFDLFLIRGSLKINVNEAVEKIRSSSLIKRELHKTINEKLTLLKRNEFFKSDEHIEDLAIVKYDLKEFQNFKDKISSILIVICEEFLK